MAITTINENDYIKDSRTVINNNFTELNTTKAPLNSPALTGTPTAPTPNPGDDSTKLATTEYVQEEIRTHANLPVGFEYFSPNPNIPQGSLPLFGGEYSRDTYSALWEWVQEQTGYCLEESDWQDLSTAQNGNVPYYSNGDGSTTFRVPSLKCWVKGADGTVTEVGSYKAAGLPNITGYMWHMPSNSAAGLTNSGGVMYQATGSGSSWRVTTTSSGELKNAEVTQFDASRSSSIYGNSATVQPESIVGMWLVKAYGTVVDTGQIDEQQYIDDRIAALPTSLATTFLPLAGGTMTGAITKSGSSGVIRRDTDDSFLYIGGSTSDSKGAYLALYGRDHSNEGRFVLAAKSVTDATTLIGYAGGTLTWNGKNVERVNASSSDYIRFESGLQICWGSAQTTTSGHTYNFPVSFNTSPKVAFSVGNTTESNTSYSTKVTNLSKTSFKGICSSTSNSGQNITCTYIAVGFWK